MFEQFSDLWSHVAWNYNFSSFGFNLIAMAVLAISKKLQPQNQLQKYSKATVSRRDFDCEAILGRVHQTGYFLTKFYKIFELLNDFEIGKNDNFNGLINQKSRECVQNVNLSHHDVNS